MYKKIFSAILFGVLTIASTSTFVSCKDYDDDINHLQAQIDDLVNNKIVTINNTLNELKAADAQLKSDIEAGDAATLAAAKKLIEEAIADCQAACKEKTDALAKKDAELDLAITKVNQRVDDVIKLLTDQDGNIREVAKDLKTLSDKLSAFESKFGNLTTAFSDLTQRVTNLEDAVKAQKAALEELAKQVNGSEVTPGTGYDDTALKDQITNAGNRIDALETKVDNLKTELNNKINDLTTQLGTLSQGLDNLKQAHETFAQQTTDKLNALTTEVSSVKAQAESTAEALGKLDVMFKILVNDLRGLVYMPKLFVDGIETIEYPYLKYERLTNVKNLAQTRKEKDDDVTVNLRDLEDYRKQATPDSVAYAPVWPVEYHMNPGNASTEFESIMGWYVYEGEVLTRAAFWETKTNQASTYGFTPRRDWDNQYKDDNIWNKSNGIMTLGLQIKNIEKIDNPGVAAGSNHFPSDLKEDTNDGQSPESVWNVMAALQAHSKKSVADYAGAGKDTIITSDYAQILPEKVKIEGMIWNTNPGYWKSQNERIKDFWENKKGYGTGDYASCAALDGGVPYKYRTGDGSATNGRDEEGVICKKWVHVWDTPEEALLHPADIELYIDQEVVLSKYLGIHWYFEQNEPITKNVADHKNIQTWKFDSEELRRYGFVWVFDTVDYYVDTNKTHDSRYMRFTDHRTGALVSADITEVGATYESTTHTSVGREPLVRVRFYHFSDISNMEKWQNLNTSNEPKKDIDAFNALNAKCVLDGYIRLHITRPEKLEIEYPTENLTFDLCNDASTTKYGRTNYWDYAMFNARVLKAETGLNNMEKEQFDALYQVELADPAAAQNPTGENRAVEVAQYIQSGSPITESPNEYYYYKNVTGVAFNNTNWSACQIGQIWTEENVDGVSNHTYWWSIPAEQLEALTHHAGSPDAGSVPVTITRWIHYTGHFYSSTREHSQGAKYDDIFIKLTLTIKRKDVDLSETKTKDENYWYDWDGSWNKCNHTDANTYRAIAENALSPVDGGSTVPWTNQILRTWDTNKVSVSNSTASKFYFAPIEYKIQAQDGTWYIVTPKRGKDDAVFDKFICKYIKGNTHTYERANKSPIVETPDAFNGDLVKNNEILNKCAIKYAPEDAEIGAGFNASEYPTLDGVFSNDTLFAVKEAEYATAREYEPIAIFTNTATGTGGGQITLLHEYAENQWIAQQAHGGATGKDYQPSGDKWKTAPTEENAYTEACLNAVGYILSEIERDGTTGLMTGKFVNKGNPLNNQLRAYVGVIATNKCNIANQMKDYKIDNFAVFQMTWERPINMLQEADFMVDAINNGDYIYMVDILRLFDWRGASNKGTGASLETGYMWGDKGIPSYWTVQDWRPNQWLWAYYNVKAINVDLATNHVYTNLSQANVNTFVTMNTVSGMVELTGKSGKTLNTWLGDGTDFDLTPYNSHDQNDAIIDYMGLERPRQEGYDPIKGKFGYIYYENNGQNVNDFDVLVPVSVVYDWGEIKAGWKYNSADAKASYVKIHIHYTRGN